MVLTALTVMEKVEVKVEGQVNHSNGKAKGKGGKKWAADIVNID